MTGYRDFLDELNAQMLAVHTRYEDLWWESKMGDHSRDAEVVSAQGAVDQFRSNRDLSARVKSALSDAQGQEKEDLLQWQKFFACYQVPPELLSLREQITRLETEVEKKKSERKEGYIDPGSGDFVEASSSQMRLMMSVNTDETIRKACFDALEQLATECVSELVELVNLRNEFARGCGYTDFYAYKLEIGEGMTRDELQALYSEIYASTRYAFKNVRAMERDLPGLRNPWNYAYMLTGDFTARSDPFLQFSEALMNWGTSFAALGIQFGGATLKLDLLDRKGKYNNGFCHWPKLVHFNGDTRIPGRTHFTCNLVPGQVGAGERSLKTLFHEGGHAAHLTNVETRAVCMNHEYPPLSAAWAEVQSMFLDTLQGGIEWLTRYAKDNAGNRYPFALFEEEVKKLHPTRPLSFMRFLMVPDFELELYSTKDLNEAKVFEIARRVYTKHTDMEVDSLRLLTVPHIYSWESACYYHSYGLALLALHQWRDYFYRKYGYIVDNPAVGKDMRDVWKLGASKTFAEFVELATGAQLSSDAYLSVITQPIDSTLALARERIARLEQVPMHQGPVFLDATIAMVDGKEVIADNSDGFEEMVRVYREWVLGKENG
jgi:oligoendopeptidase F